MKIGDLENHVYYEIYQDESQISKFTFENNVKIV
jgi:hypothetical protein